VPRVVSTDGYPHERTRSIDKRSTLRRLPTSGNPYRKRLVMRSGTDAHRRNTQCRGSFLPTDIHTGTRVVVAPTLRSGRTGTALVRHRQSNGSIPTALAPIAGSRSPLNCTARRVAGERGQARRNLHIAKHAPALTVRMHSPSIGGRSRMSTCRVCRSRSCTLRHSARMRGAPNLGNDRKPAPMQAHRQIGRDTHR